MTQTALQRTFNPIREHLPRRISNRIRGLGTALLTPVLFSWNTGHFISSLKRAAVSRHGQPLPWYTYPCIDFLKCRSYADKTVLEFGGGQSTVWWAERSAAVVTFEGDDHWLEQLQARVPRNVELHGVPMQSPQACLASVNRILDVRGNSGFDVVVIDGLWRFELIDLAVRAVHNTGCIICDNAEGYGFYEGFKDRDFRRVDFFGYAPGVVLPHCTSIFFQDRSFIFAPQSPIPVVAVRD